MKLIITDHGDPSVGIFQQDFYVDCPFNEDADAKERIFFATEMANVFKEYSEGRLSLRYDDEEIYD